MKTKVASIQLLLTIITPKDRGSKRSELLDSASAAKLILLPDTGE
jgi:hypothetical protein